LAVAKETTVRIAGLANKPPVLELRQNARAAELGAYFDEVAEQWDAYRARNPYYHGQIRSLFKAHVQPGSAVLEVGCATGDLLAEIAPERGVGIDLSARMIEVAKTKHPQLNFLCADGATFDTAERFDVIVLNNVLEYLDDIQGLFQNLRRLLRGRGRLLISTLNPLWSPLQRAGAKLGISTPDTQRNFVTAVDTKNLLELNGFEVVRLMRRMLVPKHVPLLSESINFVAAHLPVGRRFCAAEFVVARPTGDVHEYSVSVVIPAYNEAGNIEDCVRRVPKMGTRTEVIVVDDGSTDDTAVLVRAELNADVDVRCISYKPNRGKLNAVRTGFDAAKGDILMILDADMTVPPEDLPYFYDPLGNGRADFVNGTRLVYPMAGGAMKLQNFVGNKLFGTLMSWLTESHLSDTLCGTKAFFSKDYRHFRMGFDPWGDFDLLFGAAQYARKILEVPIHYQERRNGVSKMKALRHTAHLLRACWHGFWGVRYVR
jgi:SAM-dependent methyltransferase